MSLRVIEWPDFLENNFLDSRTSREAAAMTIGVFDGMHSGHRKLIEIIVRRGPNPTAVSFRENPKKIVSPAQYEGDLFSLSQKLAIFERMGVSRAVLIDFSEDFCKLKGCEFIDLLEGRGKMAFLAIGSNFRCGFKQDTDACMIREINKRKGIPTEVIPPVMPSIGGGPVSSSRIRAAMLSGDIKQAAILAGRKIELDLSGIKPVYVQDSASAVYDLASVHRIVPLSGKYPVLVYPPGIKSTAVMENGKVYLPESSTQAEFIEYLI